MLFPSISGNAPPAVGSAPTPLPEIRSKAPPAVRADTGVAAAIVQKNQRLAAGDVEQAVKSLNDFTAMVAQDVQFSLDEQSGKTIVKVVDTQTQEVLRQFPSAEALSIARSIDKMQGLLIREKA